MGFLFLCVSAFFSLLVAQFLKLAEIQPVRVLNVLVINYLAALIISFFSIDWVGFEEQKGLIPVLIHAAILGFLFIINFMIYSRSIDKNGMGVSIAAMRMSLVFPIILSLLVYKEAATTALITGIVLSFAALLLLVPSSKKEKKKQLKFATLPIMLFIISGITDSGLKIFEQEFSLFFHESKFLASLFFFAFITGSLILVFRNEFNFKWKEVVLGVVLGIVNLYSSYFLLLALKELPGSIVFPIVNLSIVFAGTLIGVIFWKDKPQKRQWVGLVLASISIMLLVI